MPAKSAKQYRAMQAAAHGHSTLGIPQSVGEEFVQATPSDKRSAYMKGKKDDGEDKTKRFMKRMAEMRSYKKRDPKRLYEMVKRRNNDRPKS